ncbi:ribosomal protein S18-alanine N-acetyltransferase [Thiothrix litoralis]|jgi:ribosomal-protein-alanine N-acetyltransferase|uniref:[Ribosomal protein bS18]-alanine N-acetyltransferase n=1 Tax=Thiothrix litoralis TaxID=2891210 RepID=A0ABX7WW08_9GAMM|nr:ribosomal protein S18-alanine N-acetyltransferase [Thiothrix litoralis]QTR47979.1 ribosomal protein S18-alanine N-acetyltransferase [Thiothrix litoralis]
MSQHHTDPDFLPLRPMTSDDVTTVMALEARAYPFPWTAAIFLDCLKHGHSGWVYEQEGQLQGYAMMMFVLDEMHLLNLCIAPESQGQGLGSRLLKTLERIARTAKAETCFLEVRQSNFSAIRLYLNTGFNEVGIRKGYYPAAIGREDAIVMAKTLF